jgi:hypothetical protein
MNNLKELIKFLDSQTEDEIYAFIFGTDEKGKPNRPKRVEVTVPNSAFVPVLKAIGLYLKTNISELRNVGMVCDFYSLLVFLDSIYSQMTEQNQEVKELNRGMLQAAIAEIRRCLRFISSDRPVD